jgi:hypothetical protein
LVQAPTQAGIIKVREFLSVVVKRHELEADHAPLCTADYNYPHVFEVWSVIKHG